MDITKDAYGVEFSFSGTWIQKAPADLEEYVVPEGVERIRRNAFAACTKLRKITFPTTLRSVELNEFEQITTLQEIVFPKAQCQNVKYLDAPSAWIIAQDEETRMVLRAPHDVASHAFPGGITAIAEEAFKGNGAEKLVIPDSVHCIGNNAFEFCTNLKEITLPRHLEYLSSELFFSCTNLERIIFQSETPPDGEEDAFIINWEETYEEDFEDEEDEDDDEWFDDDETMRGESIPYSGLIIVPKGCAENYRMNLPDHEAEIVEAE